MRGKAFGRCCFCLHGWRLWLVVPFVEVMRVRAAVVRVVLGC